MPKWNVTHAAYDENTGLEIAQYFHDEEGNYIAEINWQRFFDNNPSKRKGLVGEEYKHWIKAAPIMLAVLEAVHQDFENEVWSKDTHKLVIAAIKQAKGEKQ